MEFSSEAQWECWQVVMEADNISSEDSGMDSDEEVLIVKQLPWRSEQVNSLFKRLDQKVMQEKSPHARRQAKRRVVSSQASSRLKPLSQNYPAWLFKN